MSRFAAILLPACATALSLFSTPATAWNEEGHEIVVLVAQHYLTPAAKKSVDTLLAADMDPSTKHDLTGAAMWADSIQPTASHSNRAVIAWPNSPIALDRPDIDKACGGHKPLPAGLPPSRGPADCAVDKIGQFAGELADPATPRDERIVALKYLLSLVADLHQPVYASDNHNHGGADTRVSGGGGDPASLRHYWDAEFIDYLGDDPAAIADDLADGIRQSKTFDKMSAGTPSDWAMESFALARDHAYGKLPPVKPDGSYELPPDYMTDAIETVRLQLAHAGVRLAAVLNTALAKGE